MQKCCGDFCNVKYLLQWTSELWIWQINLQNFDKCIVGDAENVIHNNIMKHNICVRIRITVAWGFLKFWETCWILRYVLYPEQRDCKGVFFESLWKYLSKKWLCNNLRNYTKIIIFLKPDFCKIKRRHYVFFTLNRENHFFLATDPCTRICDRA